MQVAFTGIFAKASGWRAAISIPGFVECLCRANSSEMIETAASSSHADHDRHGVATSCIAQPSKQGWFESVSGLDDRQC
jgi:hypothetical protein